MSELFLLTESYLKNKMPLRGNSHWWRYQELKWNSIHYGNHQQKPFYSQAVFRGQVGTVPLEPSVGGFSAAYNVWKVMNH